MTRFSPHIVDRLAHARRVTVLTGAGTSAESGVPTFRDPQGLWSRYDPVEMASIEGFERNPVRVQSWYAARIRKMMAVSPNPCHAALAQLEETVPSVTIVTQNVDGLHQRAGSTHVIELHGNLLHAYCVSCGRTAPSLDVDADAREPARCDCGGLIRPGVVWFGEPLPETAYREAVEAAVHADVFLSIGTSGEVFPAAGLPRLAAGAGAYVLEINLRPTAVSGDADERVRGPAGVVTPELLELVRKKTTVGVD